MAKKVRDRGKLRKKRTKLYRKVRNTGFFSTIMSYTLLMVLFAAVFVLIGGYFAEYIGETKFFEEYNKLKVVADYYDNGKNYPNIEKLLSASENDFIILDESGNIIFQKGENTCSDSGTVITMCNNTESYYVYKDIKADYLVPNDHGGLDFKWKKFWKWYESNVKEKTNSHFDTDITKLDDEDLEESVNGLTVSYEMDEEDIKAIESIKIPLWVSIDLQSGGTLIGKIHFTFKMQDIILIGEVAVALVIITLVIVILLIANLISGIVKIRRVMKLYYLDTITGGYNWAYYLKNGDKRIHSYSTKKENWASVNFVFRNYRNYCLCHSLVEGEETLAELNKGITRLLDKKEICTHATNSNFALLLKYEDELQLRQRLQNMMDSLQKIDEDHNFSFQAGVALLPGVNNSSSLESDIKRKDIFIEDIYNNACAARADISDSEETGIRFFDEELLEEQRWTDTVNEHQWQALKNEEFVVYYQPKYNPNTNQLNGAEALIRWESPEFGFVTPGRFIPIFERNGFVTEIDHYMIIHVARDQKAWLDQGYKCVPVSVNVSRAHFAENDLAEQIRDMVDMEGCPRDLIEIELTESAFFDDKKAMIETIKKLKSYGFTVSMDDFGAGYSSLNSLKDMPLDVLKLDADFFRGEAEEDRDKIVVTEAIQLAKNLKMRTVAEGIEDESDVKFLAGLNCDMIQGYFYAKPMPKTDYVSRMSR